MCIKWSFPGREWLLDTSQAGWAAGVVLGWSFWLRILIWRDAHHPMCGVGVCVMLANDIIVGRSSLTARASGTSWCRMSVRWPDPGASFFPLILECGYPTSPVYAPGNTLGTKQVASQFFHHICLRGR